MGATKDAIMEEMYKEQPAEGMVFVDCKSCGDRFESFATVEGEVWESVCQYCLDQIDKLNAE